MGTFLKRTAELADRVGHGELVGRILIDQVYAFNQHEGYWVTGPLAGHVIRNHPGGGEQHFLSNPLREHASEYVQTMAGRAFEPDGLRSAMTNDLERLSAETAERTPRRHGVLAGSHHLTVTDNGETVFERLPDYPRLGRAELKALDAERQAKGAPLERHEIKRVVARHRSPGHFTDTGRMRR